MDSQSWSIIIFGYNEAESLPRVVLNAFETLQRIAPRAHEVIVVDDGSTDSTPAVLAEAQKVYSELRLIRHPRNLGIGQALLSGYRAARYENCCAIPADGQFDCEELVPFASVPPRTLVSFYRKDKAGYSGFRHRLSSFHKNLNRNFVGLDFRDINWVKIYKTQALSGLDLKISSSLVESEICAKLLLLGHRRVETPSVYHQRRAGRSRGASFRTILRAGRETAKLMWVVQSFRRRRLGYQPA